jgi:hypothetical protein
MVPHYAGAGSSGIYSTPQPSAGSRRPSPTGSRQPNRGNLSLRSGGNGIYYPYLYAVPFPYDANAEGGDAVLADDSAAYQGGPTIFDRRGDGAESYAEPAPDEQERSQATSENAQPGAGVAEPASPQLPTTLVFKGGQKLEVLNYAIVSETLYDLTPGHARKIALSDLDLAATEKENDDRGVTFELPPLPRAD